MARCIQVGFGFLVVVSLITASLRAQDFEVRLTSDHANAHDRFGGAVSIDGERLLISAINSEVAPYFTDVGRVYVFERTATAWSEVDRLEPSDPHHEVAFGRCVALEGDTAIIGAPFAHHSGAATGAVYVFERESSGWVQRSKLIGSRAQDLDRFGESLDLDGTRLAIGSPDDDAAGDDVGAVYLFERTAGGWKEQSIVESPGAFVGGRFGSAVAIEGETLAISAPWHSTALPRSGVVQLYSWSDSGSSATWEHELQLEPATPAAHQNFGRTLALEGDTLVVGTPGAQANGPFSGKITIVEREGGVWGEATDLTPQGCVAYDRFGSSLSLRGQRLAVGAPGDASTIEAGGQVWLYERTGSTWLQLNRFGVLSTAPAASSGQSCRLTEHRLIVGAPSDSSSSVNRGSVAIWSLEELPLVGTYCTGIGCPCGNEVRGGTTDHGSGCRNSTGSAARLSAQGSASVAQGDLQLLADRMPAHRLALLCLGSSSRSELFGDGFLCVADGRGPSSPPLYFGPPASTASAGELLFTAETLAALPAGNVGRTRFFQVIYRDPLGPCNHGFNSTNGLAMTPTP